jgi:probable phosphoglycerate mutase
MSLELILIRHGEVPGIDPPRFRGRMDLALTDRGQAQALALGEWVRDHFTVTAIHSSPLTRCIDTAKAIAGPLAQEVRVSMDLTDSDYGRWTGLTHPDAAARDPEPFRAWQRDPCVNPPPDGETLRQVEVRVTGAVQAILRRYTDGSVVLVTHDAIIRVLILHLLQAPLRNYTSLRQDPTAVNLIEVHTDGGYRIALLNSTAHLPRTI